MDQRYSKHLILNEIGNEGQKRLSESRVLIIGCGALGSSVSNLLVRAGIGDIIIIDRDRVEKNNLQRQLLFDESDVGKPKAEVACRKLGDINSDVKVNCIIDDVMNSNIEDFIDGADVVVDATDNIITRMIINDACVKRGVPWIYGGVLGTAGMTFNILPGGPCLRCIMPDPPSSGGMPGCDTLGILNTVPAVIGAVQSMETMKILMGKEHRKELLRYDLWNSQFSLIEIEKSSDCECCVKKKFEFLEKKENESISVLCDNSVQIVPPVSRVIDLAEIRSGLGDNYNSELNDLMLSFEVEGKKITLFRNGRMIVKGTEDKGVAKSLYSRFLGL